MPRRAEVASSLKQESASFATRELRLPARPPDLGVAREFVERAALMFGLGDDERFDFGLAANEAVTNAIRHGGPDGQGRILLRTLVDGDRLTLLVRDYGVFVAPERGGPRRLDGGRGLDMMHSLTDHFELILDSGGTTVLLSKDRA